MVRDDPPKKNEPGKNQPSCGEKLPLQTTHTHTRRRLVQRSADLGQGAPPQERAKRRTWDQPTWGEVGTPRNGPRNEPGQNSVDMGARETWAPPSLAKSRWTHESFAAQVGVKASKAAAPKWGWAFTGFTRDSPGPPGKRQGNPVRPRPG